MSAPLNIQLSEEDIQRYINKQVPTSHLARKYNCSKKTIMYHLKKLNRKEITERILMNSQSHVRASSTLANTAEILAMYDSGKHLKSISQKFGVSIPTIWKRIKAERPDAVRGLKTEKKTPIERKRSPLVIPKTIFTQIHRQFTKSMMQAYA